MFTICRLNSFSHWPIRNIFEFSDSLVRTFSRWWCQISTHASFSGCSGKFLCRLGCVKVRKITVINILKSRRGEDKSPDCIDFSTGTVTLKKKIFIHCPVKNILKTFLEFNFFVRDGFQCANQKTLKQ